MGDLLRVLREATAEDLEGVRSRLAELDAEACQLRAVEKILEKRFGGKAEPAARREPAANGAPRRGGPPPSPETTAARKRIARLLAEDGTTDAAVIKNRLDIPADKIYHLLGYERWFSKGPAGYTLTPLGSSEGAT